MYRPDSLSALGAGLEPETIDVVSAMERNRQRWNFLPPPKREEGNGHR